MIELSAMGGVRPPIATALAAARHREEQGFSAVWWADHLLHWFPLSIWQSRYVPQASSQGSPHTWFDPFAVIAAAAGVTDEVRLGVGVTDLVRRHPVQLAQTAMTLDHVTGGRFILGVGTGEALNITPIGLDNSGPVERVTEGLQVIRRLFDSPEPVSFTGRHFTLNDMALGVRPFGDRPPPIWLAAHRPRMLRLAGQTADGWIPIATDPDDYARMWGVVADAARQAGRDPGVITPALYARIVVADSMEAAHRAIDDSLLMRFIALTRPAEAFRRHGGDHPLGAGVFGLTSLLPTAYDEAAALSLARAVPLQVVRETVIHGTPDDIAASVSRFIAAGARHIQLTNMTPLADPALGPASEDLLRELVHQIRAAQQ